MIIKNIFLIKAIVLLILLAPCNAMAKEIIGKVIGISDGDTVTLLIDNTEQLKIRLAQIDAPEKNQPFGSKSKNILSDLIYKKDVRVIDIGTDRYGRTIGEMYYKDLYINLELVEVGAAWAYRKYLTDSNFILTEDAAKRNKAGLWGLQQDQIIAPWEWRKRARDTKTK